MSKSSYPLEWTAQVRGEYPHMSCELILLIGFYYFWFTMFVNGLFKNV